MNVREIMQEYLKVNGYEGLSNEECACGVGDDDEFMPCGSDKLDGCEAGHKVPCDPSNCAGDGNCDFHIAPGKKPTAPEKEE